jgi:hypothetical protein
MGNKEMIEVLRSQFAITLQKLDKIQKELEELENLQEDEKEK